MILQNIENSFLSPAFQKILQKFIFPLENLPTLLYYSCGRATASCGGCSGLAEGKV